MTEQQRERRDALAERVRADRRIRHHILFKRGEELAGWYFGQQETATRYLMVNTALFPEHRRKGIYTALLRSLLPHLEALGFQEVVSLHHATNNPVLIAKLKAGFLITGMEIDDRFGLLVRLTYFTHPIRRRMMAVRTWERWLDEELRGCLGRTGDLRGRTRVP
ncbi:GNAT family N-acetyltransferase [Geochorda subterranea]|uniref:GNAT family N-acetyltransferase n=1 Tax=Geochorda subterranea TaxID=3109564 RepID=A0ABZ1BNJ8_9FIRM|nr:GNAT family N-acetyltransferase [Limnochorda sp. LNt]WRP13702.1 GNAT family N-acetyltransferase [Limnochorda sp. LNt]